MTRFSRRIPILLIALGVMALGPGRAFSASPDANPEQAGVLMAPAADPDSLAALHRSVSEAEDKLVETRRALRKARQRRYPRGQALEALRQRARDEEAALLRAENAFLRRIAQARREESETREWATFVDRAETIEEERRRRAKPE